MNCFSKSLWFCMILVVGMFNVMVLHAQLDETVPSAQSQSDDSLKNIPERKEIVLTKLRATSQTEISVLSQNDLVVEYSPEKDPKSRFEQTEAGLEISVMRAQCIYNNSSWSNTVVVKLDNADFVDQPLKNNSPLE